MEELHNNGVEIYQFPTDDETVADLNARMNVSKQGRKRGRSEGGRREGGGGRKERRRGGK